MKFYKSAAVVAASAIICTSVAAAAYAGTAIEDTANETALSAVDNDVFDASLTEESKDETVYVIQAVNGNTNKIIVSDIFENVSAENAEKYIAGLYDIENISENCWQGKSDKELPIQMKITYTLDGEEIGPEDLAGKSGHVVIRFDYTNTLTANITVNNSTEEIYVPFAAITGTYLDNENFSNIEVTNGCAVNDGGRTYIAGIAFPGLNDDIVSDIQTIKCELAEKLPDKADDINSVEIVFPDYIEISADTEDFQLATAFTIVSVINSDFDISSIFSGIDSSMIDDCFAELQDAMQQLSDGSSELSSGLETLLTSCNDLSDGITQLSDGLATLAENNESIVSGAETVFNTLLSTAESKLNEAGLSITELSIDNYGDTLDSLLLTFADPAAYAQAQAKAQVEAAVKSNENVIRSQVEAAVREQVTASVTEVVKTQVLGQILASQGLDADKYDTALAAGVISDEQKGLLNSALENQMASDEIIAVINTKTDEQMSTADIAETIEINVENQISSIIEENLNSEEVKAQITAGTEAAAQGAENIKALKEQLDSYNEFYSGLKTYTDGVASASDGATTISDSMPDLIDGVTQLHDGAVSLSDALKELKDFSDSADVNTQNLRNKLDAVINVGKDYTSYTDNPDNINSKVKFIYRTESIG